MRKRILILFVIFITIWLASCSQHIDNNLNSDNDNTDVNENTDSTSDNDDNQNIEEETMNNKIYITINDLQFTATINDSMAAKQLLSMMPFTINMNELNNNEKYYYFDESLPTNAKNVQSIKTGDIMLYGSSCLVLFYKNFNTSYSYTPIGKIDNPTGLEQALGEYSVEITFSK